MKFSSNQTFDYPSVNTIDKLPTIRSHSRLPYRRTELLKFSTDILQIFNRIIKPLEKTEPTRNISDSFHPYKFTYHCSYWGKVSRENIGFQLCANNSRGSNELTHPNWKILFETVKFDRTKFPIK